MQYSTILITLATFATTFVMAENDTAIANGTAATNGTGATNGTSSSSLAGVAGALQLGTAGTIGALAAGAVALII
ncbi:hypothetical protein KGF57_003852 [Candida theae]|uniref:Uncharacterized protein n=1 Tax=Candida theae TaxID=1198502 RepID=A0AAD5BCY1_9ASCO|nr:uncharacterized protein KGF57_003852 [Candida theae]KAI5954828.1 hypothetical protein KGF57_003852 [Candida theae]